MSRRSRRNRSGAVRLMALALALGVLPSPLAAGEARPARRAPAAPGGSLQPQLVPLPVEKCIDCRSKARRRLAVMPVKASGLSAELGLPGEVVAAKVRDAVEAALADSPALIVMNRAELSDVVAEQRLSASGLANPELTPAARRLIPAQILLYATTDRVDVSTRTEKQSNSTAENYHRQALEKEKQAADAEREAQAAAAERDRMETYNNRGVADTLGESLDRLNDCGRFQRMCGPYSAPSCQSMADNMARNCESQKRTNQENRDRTFRMKLEGKERLASQMQAESTRLQREAQFLRRQADLEAQKTVAETKHTTAEVVVTWKAVDTSTGAVVGSGTANASETIADTGAAVQSAFRSTETSSSTRYDAVVNRALAGVTSKLRGEVESRLATVPLRVKIARVSAAGVVINAGKDLGVDVGDTFGVRARGEALTDPDTGLPLENPGPPVGVIRVSQVFEKSALAQVVEKAGPLSRGHELEWIGVFGLASTK